MDIDPSSTVSASRLVVSLVSWFLLLFGIAIIRLEFAYWLNGVLLTVILPLLIWYLGNHSIFLSVSSGTAVTAPVEAKPTRLRFPCVLRNCGIVLANFS